MAALPSRTAARTRCPTSAPSSPAAASGWARALTGIDVPTLRDVWATAPYLHDGSAATLEAAVRAHNNVTIADADLANLVAYLREIGGEEGAAPSPVGTGLVGNYFNNTTLSGTAVLVRTEAVNFNWGTGFSRRRRELPTTSRYVGPARLHRLPAATTASRPTLMMAYAFGSTVYR